MPSPTLLRASAGALGCAAQLASRRAFTTTVAVRGGGAPHYDPPSGWLFGVRPGEEYKKEGWEGPFFYGICGSFVVATIAYAFKPDTRYVPFLVVWMGEFGRMRGRRLRRQRMRDGWD